MSSGLSDSVSKFSFLRRWLDSESIAMVVVLLLRVAWISAILPIVVASIPSSKITPYREFFIRLLGRGKIMDSSSKRLSVPQKYFCHFYIIAVIWTTFLLVFTWTYAFNTTPIVSEAEVYSSIASHLAGASHERFLPMSHLHGVWKSVFLLFLMEAQVLRRLYESIYVFKYSPSASMHICGYFTGLFFYIAAPLSLCSSYTLEVCKVVADLSREFVVKGKDRMQFGRFDFSGHVNPLMQLEWCTWIGAAIFVWGWIHQLRCHAILGSIRKNSRELDKYAIPHGDWFEHVSSPHYLAEIVMYGGVVIASGFTDISIWLVFVFVLANLSYAAGETHKWYLRKFDNYPRRRRAIIPFVY